MATSASSASMTTNHAAPFLAATTGGAESFDRSSGDRVRDSAGTGGEENIAGGRAGVADERGAAGNNHHPNH